MGLDNPLHIAFLLIVLLLVFGAKRLPEMGKSLGSGMRGFKDAINPDAELHAALTAAPQADPVPVEHADVQTAITAAAQAGSVPVEHVDQERTAA
jgi:sec-independent protein translocase protein TatA